MNKTIAARFATTASVVTLLVMLAPALRLPAQAMTPGGPGSNHRDVLVAWGDEEDRDRDRGHEERGHDRG